MSQATPLTRALRVAAGAAISGGLLWFVARAVGGRLAEIDPAHWTPAPGTLALSAVVLLVAYVGFWRLWAATLADCGGRVPHAASHRAWWLSQLGKYVPGKVWAAVGRVYLLGRRGVPASASGASVLYELAFLVLAGLLVGAATGAPGATAALASAGVVAVGLVAFSRPEWRRRLHRGAGDRAGTTALPLPTLAARVAGYAVVWVVVGAAFALLVASVHPIAPRDAVAVGGAFVLSWVAGSIVVLAPAGLGVREGVLLGALSAIVPAEVAIVVTVASRVWTTAVEGVGIALGVAIGAFGAPR